MLDDVQAPIRLWPPVLRGSQLTVGEVEEKPFARRPYPPFMTSTLQQEADRRAAVLRRAHDQHRPAAVRERLRARHATDSTTLSQSAINAARTQARQLYGEEYVYHRRANTPAR